MNLQIFTLSILLGFFLERLLHVLAFCFVTLCTPAGEKGNAAVRTTTGFLSILTALVSSISAVVLQLISLVATYAFTIVAFFVVLVVLYVCLEYSVDFLFSSVIAWNKGIGPSLQILVVWPARVVFWFFEAVCPIWNAIVWFITKLPPQILVDTVLNHLGLLYNAVFCLGRVFMTLAQSLAGWIESFVCADQCLEAGARVMDLITPMLHLRNTTVWVSQWARVTCSVMSGPIDFVTYPLLDINFAKGVHFLGNSMLYSVFHLPAITVERCNRFKAEGAIMCVPDVEPVFNMVVAGFRYMGQFVDNWLDVLILIVEGTLNRPSPSCTTVPDLLRDFNFKVNTFGSNETVMVGMTPHMFARTDGTSVQYFSMDRNWQTVVHRDAFPFDVNVGYGVAAISHYVDSDHDTRGDDTTALMGCSCGYGDNGIQLSCGVAMFADGVAAEERTIPVDFQLPSTGRYMHCDKLVVRVESVRWPVSRFTGSAQPCTSKGTCLQVDAVLWVKPRCSVDTVDLVCIESFTRASCYPYCMALHARGSGPQPLVLHDASEWSNGVTMLRRDCGLYNMSTDEQGTGTSVYIPTSVYPLSGVFGPRPCVFNPLTVSQVPKSSMPEYAAYASIDLQSQPFLFANDLALVAVPGQLGTWSIQVNRIFGSQANEFTMIPLNQNIPSLGPCRTPADCDNVGEQCMTAQGCKPAIPYGYSHSGSSYVLGTTSERFVFWVTNPSLEPFYAFSRYCRNKGNDTNVLQISVISSYGGIRLWRMDPYIYCPETNGVKECPEQAAVLTKMVESMDFEDFDDSMCNREFNVMAVNLDYITEDNLALTVLRTTLANLNTETLRPINQSLASYVTLWVNPADLEQRNDTMWMPEASSPALTQGFLCPSQRRTPNLGSLLAEALNSFVFAIRLPVNLLLSFPIILDFYGGRCPLLNRGHSMLKSCGSELLSLEDFFSSVYRCNSLFWMTFSIVADAFGPGLPQTFMNGVVTMGENGNALAMLPGVASGLSKVGQTEPVGRVTELLSQTIAGLPSAVHAANVAMKNPIANVHFMYRLASRMLMQILEASQNRRTVANIFWNVVADGFKDHEDLVLQRMRRTCAGFSMVIGYNTPLGRLAHRWCNAWVELQRGFHVMSSVFFVDVPLMDCVCVKSVGSSFTSFVRSKCWPDTPDLQKPYINAISELDYDTACPVIVKMTQLHFQEALDPMFSLLEAGSREVTSVMDYFVGGGDCNNFADNPYVVTLIPQPVDYFRACGLTDTCRLRCLAEIQAFEAQNVQAPIQELETKTVNSLFFNDMDDDTYAAIRAVAVMEMHNCSYACGFVQTTGAYSDRCFLVGGENQNGQLQILSYCAPVQIGANVRRGPQDWTVENLVVGALQAYFVFEPNPLEFWNSFRLVVLTVGGVHLCHTSCGEIYSAEDLGVYKFSTLRVLGTTVVIGAHKGDGSEAVFCFQFMGGIITQPTLCNGHTGSRPVCLLDSSYSCARVLFLDSPVRLCYQSMGVLSSCVTYNTPVNFEYSVTASGLLAQTAAVPDLTVWHIFNVLPQSSHWLGMSKVVLSESAVGSWSNGIPAQMAITVMRSCSLEYCVGCLDLGLQRLCYAAAQCQIARCIGTMVHQRRPLCSIGGFLAATIQNMLSFTKGAWRVISETMVAVLGVSGGLALPTQIKWPDQAFFDYICSAKDMTSTAISIVTSTISGDTQSLGRMPIAQSSTSAISNNALILFSMTMAATTNFLNQIAMAPLYMAMATQKTYICSANSILAVVGGDKMSVRLGDPALQNASNKAAGQCLSQYHTENTQGAVEGSVSIAALEAISQILSAIKLESLIHPIDAFLTWLQGVVLGLQDLMQTIDRNRSVYTLSDTACACIKCRNTWSTSAKILTHIISAFLYTTKSRIGCLQTHLHLRHQ